LLLEKIIPEHGLITDKLKLEYEEFNRVSAAGVPTQQRLGQMMENCGFAFLVFTGEDSHTDKTKHARENVIDEAGLFQSRLGWQKAIILREKKCREFSNIVGLTQITFPKGKIEDSFEKVRGVLVREGLISSKRMFWRADAVPWRYEPSGTSVS